MEVSGQHHDPATLPQERDPCQLYRRLCVPYRRSGWVRKILPQPGFDPWTVQQVAIRSTDCAVPTHITYIETY
jgi:hypothetical protein